MERIIKSDSTFISITGGITMEELISIYKKKVNEITSRYEQVSNLKIRCDCLEYNDGEYYDEQIIISYNRLETEDEYKKRIDWIDYSKKAQEIADSRLLKELIYKYPDIANNYIKELNKF